MLTDIFTSPGASLLILIVQGLFAWALWSLRRAFVRNDDYLLHLQRESRRESATARRLSALEEHLRQMPAGDDLAGLHGELAAPAEQSARRLVVVWGGSAGQSGRSASAAGPGTLSTARKAAAKPVNLTNE